MSSAQRASIQSQPMTTGTDSSSQSTCRALRKFTAHSFAECNDTILSHILQRQGSARPAATSAPQPARPRRFLRSAIRTAIRPAIRPDAA